MIPDSTRIELLASAMLRGYAARYPSEDFEVQAVEQEFLTDIRNPETGAESRTFRLAGKVDGLVRRTVRVVYESDEEQLRLPLDDGTAPEVVIDVDEAERMLGERNEAKP